MTRKYEVGDVVQVVQKVEQEEGWDNVWVLPMDQYVSHGYTVQAVSDHGVELGDEQYCFPPSSLKLVRTVETT